MSRSTAPSSTPRSSAKYRVGPAGIHFFNRSTGINVLVDEVRPPRELWTVAPRYVSVALTNACDLHCPYCYAPKHRASLDRGLLLQWLRELDANGCFGVGFGGGEPTLYAGFSQLCRTVAGATGLAVTFTSHANRIDEQLAAELRGSVHFIRVSMDGVGPTYEALRGRRFSEFLARVERVRTISPFGINYVVNARTLTDLDEAISIASDLGASEFLLLPEQPVRGGGGIDQQAKDALRRWVCSYTGSVPLRVSAAGAGELPVCDPMSAEDGLRAFAHIDSTGLLKWSSFDESGVPIGAVSVMEALRTLEMLSRS